MSAQHQGFFARLRMRRQREPQERSEPAPDIQYPFHQSVRPIQPTSMRDVLGSLGTLPIGTHQLPRAGAFREAYFHAFPERYQPRILSLDSAERRGNTGAVVKRVFEELQATQNTPLPELSLKPARPAWLTEILPDGYRVRKTEPEDDAWLIHSNKADSLDNIAEIKVWGEPEQKQPSTELILKELAVGEDDHTETNIRAIRRRTNKMLSGALDLESEQVQ
jgi:hypothetical protein